MNIGKKFEKLNTAFELNDDIVLGLDIGIASCGWAWLDTTAKKIIAAGTFGFETPEVAKTRESKAAVRRVFRGQRRRLRRRRNRMRDIRQLLHKNGLLSTATPPIEGQPKPAINPWQMRAKGLQKKLDGDEFASALIHIAKHRGYRSNSKSEGAQDAPSEDKKALSGLAAILEKSARYETVGEMFALDEEFTSKKRNRAGEYTHTVFRHLHETEIGILFEKQRRFGSKFTDVTLEQEFATLAFDQLALGGSEDMLGRCPFEPKEFRASSLAFSFERFRFLSKLLHSRISDDSRSGRTLTREELAKAMNGFGKGAKAISWSRLVKQIGLPTGTGFVGVGDKGMKKDVARNSKGCAFGSNTLYNVLGEAAWNSLVKTPEVLDGIAHILTFQEDVDHISAKLGQLELSPSILDTLMAAVKQGKFAKFAKAGHISTKAARNILPGLLAGKVYSEACEFAGYDHTTENPAKLEAMTNPVAKRAVLETLKQVNALVRHFGQRPGAVHVELGRDMGKGPKERGQIKAGMDRRTAEKSVAKAAFCQLVGKDDCSFDELQRYELWKEQMHECMFCYPRSNIEPMALRHGQHVVEIEHILPIGRSQDNSWNNKVLACATCNRNKGAKTPFEWFGDDHARWDEFNFRVKSLFGDGKIKGFKVRNLTMRDFDERAGGFIERNLNDLRYASKVILGELRHLYQPLETEGRKRLFARPGTVTGILRRLWGLQSTKYIKTGDNTEKRIEDERHHAIDAIVVAVCSEAVLQRLTKEMQHREMKSLPPLKIDDFQPPWSEFRQDVLNAREAIPVARTENRRARGAGHAATIRQIRIEDERRIVYERVAVDKLTHAKLDLLKDPERNQEVLDALFNWIAAGKPADQPPVRANGYKIKKVTLRAEKKPTTQRAGFTAHGGLVDNADMVRLDVFEKAKKFYLVPIYAHQVADKASWPKPPNRAITAHKSEDQWPVVDDTYTFKFSLYPFSWIECVSRKGEVFEGYYRGTNRSTGYIILSDEYSRQQQKGTGAKLLHTFKKFQVDRLGQKTEIKSETRTWHGEACT